MRRFLLLPPFLLLLLVAACAGPQNPPTQSLEPTAAEAPTATEISAVTEAPTATEISANLDEQAAEPNATASPIAELPAEEAAASVPQDEPAQADAVEGVDWLTVVGRTEEGQATLGNPDAAVTLIDYSDFM